MTKIGRCMQEVKPGSSSCMRKISPGTSLEKPEKSGAEVTSPATHSIFHLGECQPRPTVQRTDVM